MPIVVYKRIPIPRMFSVDDLIQWVVFSFFGGLCLGFVIVYWVMF